MATSICRAAVRGAPLVPLLIVALVVGAGAQSIIPPQLPGYLCANFGGVKGITGPVALIVFASALIFGMIRRHSNLVVDLVVGGFIALVIYNLPTILSNLGINTGCS